MNYDPDDIPLNDLVYNQPPTIAQINIDIENSPTSPSEDVSLQHSSSTSPANLLKIPVLGHLLRFFLLIGRCFQFCYFRLKYLVLPHRIATLCLLQTFFLLLRFLGILSPKALLYLTFFFLFAILTIIILYRCLVIARRERRFPRPNQTLQEQSQNLYAMRRAQALEQLNDRILEHIILNSTYQRSNLVIPTGNVGRIQLVHLNPGMNNIIGARTQIRSISRQLLRLISEFIEEQQLQQSRNQRAGLTDEQINNLQTEKYLIPLNGVEEAETCSICIDEFKQEQELRKLPCHHRFHLNCVDEWLRISNNCPNCKAEIHPANNNNNNPGPENNV